MPLAKVNGLGATMKIFAFFLMAATLLPLSVGCSNKVAFTKNLTPQEAMSGEFLTENFTQGYSAKKLDIIVVVDNSLSMAAEQQKLGDRIGSFLSTLYDVDWQIAITTTDVSDGPYGLKGEFLNLEGLSTQVLTSRTPNYEAVFKATVVRKESIGCTANCPSGDEQPLAATIMAMQKNKGVNRGFFRADADLAVLILSDEDEMSDGPSQATQPQQVVTAAAKIWGDRKKLIGYGMIIQPRDQACLDMNNGQGRVANAVSQLAFITGGITGSICDADYSAALSAIGDRARKLLEGIQLSFYPEHGTIEIQFDPLHMTNWTVEGRRIVFQNPPPKGTKIGVYYQVK